MHDVPDRLERQLLDRKDVLHLSPKDEDLDESQDRHEVVRGVSGGRHERRNDHHNDGPTP